MVHRQYAAALEAYQRDPDKSAVLWNKIGVAYHHMFALDQARKYYQMALAMKPDYPEALNNLAAVYHGQHEYKQAERTYKLALKYAPSSAITVLQPGNGLLRRREIQARDAGVSQGPGAEPSHLRPGSGARSFRSPAPAASSSPSITTWPKPTPPKERRRKRSATCARLSKAGFRDRKQLMKDKEFASLRATPEFHQLMIEQTGGECPGA